MNSISFCYGSVHYLRTMYAPFRALFPKFLTPRLTNEFGNPLDDLLGRSIPTNNRAGYLICKKMMNKVLTTEFIHNLNRRLFLNCKLCLKFQFTVNSIRRISQQNSTSRCNTQFSSTYKVKLIEPAHTVLISK